MLKVIIVDDERLARQAIKCLLENIDFVEIVGEAECIQKAIEQVKKKKPHLVFMDIQLSNENGFDFFNAIENPPPVAFVTAHNDYALEAFSVNAIDYLLKPVTAARIEETIKRVRKTQFTNSIQITEKVKTIELRTPGKTLVTKIDDIAALYSERDFTHVLLAHQPPIMVYRSLSSLEMSLQEPNFLRLGRSTIINLARVSQVKIHIQSGANIVLEGVEEELTVGRAAATRLRLALENES